LIIVITVSIADGIFTNSLNKVFIVSLCPRERSDLVWACAVGFLRKSDVRSGARGHVIEVEMFSTFQANARDH
jgi:hypothetical protein